MTKKTSKKHRKTIKHKRRENTQTFQNIYSSIVALLGRTWVIPMLFLLFSLAYFFVFVFQDNALVSTESGSARGGPESGFDTVKNPFSENSLWRNTLMGGHPVSSVLQPYLKNLFTLLINIFFVGYRSLALYLAAITFAAGYFMYLYIRTLNIRKEFAFIAGLFYMFAPMILSHTYTVHDSKMGVIALLPLMFFWIEKAFTTQKFRYFLYFSGVMAMVIGTAHLQLAFFAFWAVGFYFLYRVYTHFREKRSLSQLFRYGGVFVLSVLLGLSIAARGFAPNYWHTTTVSKRASTQDDPGTASTFEYSASWSLHPEEAVSLLLPHFGNYLDNYWGRNAFKLNSEYFGFYPMLLFFAGFLLWKNDRRVRFFIFLFFFAFLFALGANTPFFKLCYYLIPGVKSFRAPSLISFLFSFSATIVMAISLNAFFSPGSTEYGEKLRKRFTILLYAAFAIGALFLVLSKPILNLWKTFLPENVLLARQEIMMNNASAISFDAFLVLLFCGLLFFLFRWYHSAGEGSASGRQKKAGLVVLVSVMSLAAFVDTWRVDKDFLNPIPYNRIPTPESKKISAYESLKEIDRSPYRVFPVHAYSVNPPDRRFSYPGVVMVFGFLDFTLKRFDKIMNYSTAGFSLWNLLNVKYFVSPGQITDENLQLKLVSNPYFVYENKAVFPYYGLVHRYRVIEGADDVLNYVLKPEFNGGQEVVIEKDPPAFVGENADSTAIAQTPDEVDFLDSEDFYSGRKNIFQFRVSSDLPGFFILSENYHPEWKATIDDVETEIYRANYVWKGVFVPAGEHYITFTFIPREIVYSRWVSLAGMILFAVLLGITAISGRRKNNTE